MSTVQDISYGLLPQEYRERIAHTQWARLALVIHAGIFLIFAVGSVLLLPSYLFLTLQEPGILRQVDIANQSVAAKRVEEAEASIRAVNQRMQIFQQIRIDASSSLATLLSEFAKTIPSGVHISTISWDEAGRQIIINGKADRRNVLLAFLETLKASSLFKEADLPVSSLLKEENISFSLIVYVEDADNGI